MPCCAGGIPPCIPARCVCALQRLCPRHVPNDRRRPDRIPRFRAGEPALLPQFNSDHNDAQSYNYRLLPPPRPAVRPDSPPPPLAWLRARVAVCCALDGLRGGGWMHAPRAHRRAARGGGGAQVPHSTRRLQHPQVRWVHARRVGDVACSWGLICVPSTADHHRCCCYCCSSQPRWATSRAPWSVDLTYIRPPPLPLPLRGNIPDDGCRRLFCWRFPCCDRLPASLPLYNRTSTPSPPWRGCHR